jgi:hypothetical protein
VCKDLDFRKLLVEGKVLSRNLCYCRSTECK